MARTKGRKRKWSVVHPRAAGIDIGSRFHVVAVSEDLDAKPVRTFSTFTNDLHRLAEWLKGLGIATVAMESTGVYWIPAFEILQARGVEVVLVNARNAKTVPGRKTDVNDAQWLQQLHQYGLLRGSFHPSRGIAALRAYLRHRERLLDYAAAHVQHMHKALTQMNVQLHHVVSDVTGATGLRIIRAIVSGNTDPEELARFRDVRCKASRETIREALVGNYEREHVFALSQSLALYDFYKVQVAGCDEEIESALAHLRSGVATPQAPLPPPRAKKSHSANGLRFDVREALFALLGVDLTQIHGLGPYVALEAGQRMRDRHDEVAQFQALHFVALPGSGQQDLRGQGALLAHSTILKSSGLIAALGGHRRGAHGHGARGVLPSPFSAGRQGQGDHGDCSEIGGVVLQRHALWHGVRRSGRLVL